jgi:hypothetical protein
VMEGEDAEMDNTSWELKDGTVAAFLEGDRSADEEVEERSRWGLALVSRTVSLLLSRLALSA